MSQLPSTFKLAIICGGPSLERGISLNSARSVLDHLQSSSIEIIPLFVDYKKNFYQISTAQLYSNTPADFDFKLQQTGEILDERALKALLQNVDLVFPVIHGAFGEDGELQQMLEDFDVPFIGHSSSCCRQMFNKHRVNRLLREMDLPALPQLHIDRSLSSEYAKGAVEKFFEVHQLQRAIVKPNAGGSSIGVSSVSTPQEAWIKIQDLYFKEQHTEVVVEPFCEGKEFTVLVIANPEGDPVAFIPTEIELSYENHDFFDYRKKYLPTNLAAYYTPPRFSQLSVEYIRTQAERLFSLLGMRDFVRLDGWLMADETVYFTDFNPISGMEQNSFLFRQACLLGMTHREILEYISKSACKRYGITFPKTEVNSTENKRSVFVLFGNANAERQVSLMSGTNVWLKLMKSHAFAPEPFLYASDKQVWKLPYSYTLNHTVEEILSNCHEKHEMQTHWQHLIEKICKRLKINFPSIQEPQCMHLLEFLESAKENGAFVFIGLHGAEGEDGTLQKSLESLNIEFNGSNSHVSSLCMDKYLTGTKIEALKNPELQSLPKVRFALKQFAGWGIHSFENWWSEVCQTLESEKVIVKPRFDGCSAGIVLLCSAKEVQLYAQLMNNGVKWIPSHTFSNQSCPIEMPSSVDQEFLLEAYIETDTILAHTGKIRHISKEGWIELTIGVLEKGGIYHAFNPSITVAEGAILTLEEKFQGGTGINLTPPPEEILSASAVEKIKNLTCKAAQVIGVQNYARLDVFFNRLSEKMIVIEINSLPGLTPSTVIYHQGLAEKDPLAPLQLLETLIMRV